MFEIEDILNDPDLFHGRYLTYEAHYEDALDCLSFGLDYEFWRTDNHCDTDLEDYEAELIWEVAKWVLSSDYCEAVTRNYPKLRAAYLWMHNGTPKLKPDDAVEVYSKADDIIIYFNPTCIRVRESDPTCVYIQDKYSGMYFWFHVWVNEEDKNIDAEWNQDIFDPHNPDDVLRMYLQSDSTIFSQTLSTALDYQKQIGNVYQWNDGSWHKNPETK